MNELKQKLSGAQWTKFGDFKITVDGEEVVVVLRRPPAGVLVKELDAAKAAGEVDDGGKPTGAMNGIRLMARLTRLCLFMPGAVRPLYDASEAEHLVEAPWLANLQEHVTECVSPVTTQIEGAKGN